MFYFDFGQHEICKVPGFYIFVQMYNLQAWMIKVFISFKQTLDLVLKWRTSINTSYAGNKCDFYHQDVKSQLSYLGLGFPRSNVSDSRFCHKDNFRVLTQWYLLLTDWLFTIWVAPYAAQYLASISPGDTVLPCCVSGVQETEVVSDVLVPRHCQGQEEDVVLLLLWRPQKVIGRRPEVHSGTHLFVIAQCLVVACQRLIGNYFWELLVVST